MFKTVRNMGISLLVFAYIVVVVFFLIRDYKKDISNALNDSLDFIGGTLTAMVADSSDKKVAVGTYNDFKKQVLNHKVAPQQVESMAANILNLSTSGVMLSPAEAEEILKSAFTIRIEKDSTFQDSLTVTLDEMSFPKISIDSKPRKPVTSDDLKMSNTRLFSIHDFEKKISRLQENRKISDKDFRRNMYYDSKNGLKLIVDPKSKEHFLKDDIAEIDIELKNLENEDVLVYNNDLKKALENEKKKLEKELRLIIFTRNKRNVERAKSAVELEQMETFKKLRLMGIAHIDKDSLDKIIKKMELESIGTAKESEVDPKNSTKKK